MSKNNSDKELAQ